MASSAGELWLEQLMAAGISRRWFAVVTVLVAGTSCTAVHDGRTARLDATAPLAGADPPPATAPEAKAPRYTYVLVHGAWAGAWEWKRVGELLTAHGHIVYRPTLTGQGERVHLANPDIDLETHITDVVNVILFEDLRDIVLMGHSYGGMVITGVAEKVPDRVLAMVYVDAFLPNDGESLNSTTTRPRPTTNGFANPAGWPGPPGKQPPYIVPHPAKTFSQPISLKNPAARTIPTTYILTADAGRPPEQDRFYRFYQRAQDRGWTTWIMQGGHVVNITAPEELTGLLQTAPAHAKAAK
jgi:pimeloyl-ACP methyl ester carboxylesterase